MDKLLGWDLPQLILITVEVNEKGDVVELDEAGRLKTYLAADGSFYATYQYLTNSCEEPIRVDFYGDELSLRRFASAQQEPKTAAPRRSPAPASKVA
jgi:hypothetical protein